MLTLPNIDLKIKSTKSYKEARYDEYYVINEEKEILHEALESRYLEVIQFLLKNKSLNINCTLSTRKVYCDYFSTASDYYEENCEKTLLHLALEKGYLDIIEFLLLNPNILINQYSTTSIEKAGGCETYEETTNSIVKSSLYYAIENGKIEPIKLLLKKFCIDVNFGIKEAFTNWKGTIMIQNKTPLFLAVEKQNLEIVQLLLEKSKTDVKFVSTYYTYENYERKIHKNTALQLATEKKNVPIIRLLLEKNTNKYI